MKRKPRVGPKNEKQASLPPCHPASLRSLPLPLGRARARNISHPWPKCPNPPKSFHPHAETKGAAPGQPTRADGQWGGGAAGRGRGEGRGGERGEGGRSQAGYLEWRESGGNEIYRNAGRVSALACGRRCYCRRDHLQTETESPCASPPCCCCCCCCCEQLQAQRPTPHPSSAQPSSSSSPPPSPLSVAAAIAARRTAAAGGAGVEDDDDGALAGRNTGIAIDPSWL